MLQACYPADSSASLLTCNDRRIPTSDLELDLAHRQAQAVSKLYARLNGNAFGVAPVEAAGESWLCSGLRLKHMADLGKPTIRAVGMYKA